MTPETHEDAFDAFGQRAARRLPSILVAGRHPFHAAAIPDIVFKLGPPFVLEMTAALRRDDLEAYLLPQPDHFPGSRTRDDLLVRRRL